LGEYQEKCTTIFGTVFLTQRSMGYYFLVQRTDPLVGILRIAQSWGITKHGFIMMFEQE
jgi:hypothetical protein